MSKTIRYLSFAVIFTLLVVLGLRQALSWFEPLRDFFDVRAKAQVNSSQTIVQGIQPLGQLVSYRTQMAKVGIEINIRRGIGQVCYFWGIHAAQAAIDAGIDLTQVNESDVVFNEAENAYTLTLPSPEITSCNLDPMQTQQYEKGGDTPLCPMDWDEVRRLASYVALRDFRTEAVEGGLLEAAKRQAEIVLSNFIKAFTNAETVTITYREPTEIVYPPSCDPKIPGTWRWDDSIQAWREN